MRNDNDGNAELLIDLLNQRKDRVRCVGVKRTRSLIAEQDLRVDRKRTRDRDALLLAAGELGRIGVCLIRQPPSSKSSSARRLASAF